MKAYVQWPIQAVRALSTHAPPCVLKGITSVFRQRFPLFLAMLFASAAVLGAIVLTFAHESGKTGDASTFHFARVVAYNMANVYALKMAAVFMISTSTVAVQSGFMPRWMALLGFAFGLTLLIGSYFISWSSIVLPIWVFLVSCYILLDNFSAGR